MITIEKSCAQCSVRDRIPKTAYQLETTPCSTQQRSRLRDGTRVPIEVSREADAQYPNLYLVLVTHFLAAMRWIHT